MSDYAAVRCLFCLCGHEKTVAESIRLSGWGRALFGEKVKLHRGSRGMTEEMLPLLPGYLFLYQTDDQLQRVSREDLAELSYVIRVLTYGEGQQDTLTGADLDFADWLWQAGGRIAPLRAIREGDHVTIRDPLFERLRGTVVHMDRRKRSVTVKLDADFGSKQLTLSYDLTEPEGER